MPVLPPVADTIRVRLGWKDQNNNTFGSRFYLKYSGGPPSAADATTLATNVSAHWNTRFTALLTTTSALVDVIATDMASASGVEQTWTGSIPGTRTGAGLPDDVAMNIGFLIARRYRGGKPKIFLPIGADADLASPRTWSASFVTAAGTAWGNFMADILADTYSSFTLQDNVGVSYYEGFTSVLNPITGRTRDVPKVRSGGPITDNIVNHVVQSRLGSQRRRLTSA